MSRSLVDGSPVSSAAQPAAVPPDPRIERARPNLLGFSILALQLALITGVLYFYRVGQYKGPDLSFTYLCYTAFGLFAVHYWLPFRFKETFTVATSLLAAFVWLDWKVAVCLVGAGLFFFAVIRCPLSYWTRVSIVVAAFVAGGALVLYPAQGEQLIRKVSPVAIPQTFWAMFGSFFLLRMIIYMHDVKHMKEKPSFQAYLAYFFLLPNYVFPLMPVVDYATMRAGYYRRNTHQIAQEGIQWISRGLIQLICYQIVFYLREYLSTLGIRSFGAVVAHMALTLLLYIRVSGQFHLIVGMLHLFGYDLPETFRKYLLSTSFTDYWRRVNIYWKDFMVKLVYFPVFFRFRKGGQLRAKLIGTVSVFVVTWALHSAQYLFIRGSGLFTFTDIVFWTIFGILMTFNMWQEHVQEAKGVKKVVPTRFRTICSNVATVSVIMVLWSMWDAPTFGDWFDFLAYWRRA